MSKVIVVGAGINGVTAGIELKKRGHNVVLVDPGPLPHPLAASTDISKAVRAAYGADEEYTELAARSIKLWRKWNEEFGVELYHEVGVMFVRHREMKLGDFEHESFKTLQKHRRKIERVNSAQFRKRFPAWNPELWRDGILEREAGYVESGLVVAKLVERAKSLGIELRDTVPGARCRPTPRNAQSLSPKKKTCGSFYRRHFPLSWMRRLFTRGCACIAIRTMDIFGSHAIRNVKD